MPDQNRPDQGKGQFKCSHCGMTFENDQKLRDHERTTHKEVVEQTGKGNRPGQGEGRRGESGESNRPGEGNRPHEDDRPWQGNPQR